MQDILGNYNKHRFLIGVILNSAFICIEVFYGLQANSVALLADALHNASDVLGLCLAWFSYVIAQRQATRRFTYGFKNATIFAAFINSLILIFAIANLMWESFARLLNPEPVVAITVIWIALLGVLINGTTALLFAQGREKDLNIFSIFLNMTLDTLLSAGIVIGGAFILWKKWVFIDPGLGIIIGLTIIYSVWKLFKESLDLIMQAVPSSVDLNAVIADIENNPAIIAYHDLHIWALSTTETALSVHVITAPENFSPAITMHLADVLREKHNIQHATIQLEVADGRDNCLAC